MSKLVLVVEATSETRESIGEVLFAHGHSSVLTATARDGLLWLQGGLQCDLVLLGLAGAAAFREEQQRDAAIAAIPVIAMIEADDGGVASEGVLRKPFGPDDLLRAIDAVRL